MPSRPTCAHCGLSATIIAPCAACRQKVCRACAFSWATWTTGVGKQRVARLKVVCRQCWHSRNSTAGERT